MQSELTYTVEKYKSFTFLTIKNGNLEVVFSTLGASIYSIKYCDELMTLTPSNKDEFFHENIYHGKTIGRICNRFKGNIVTIDGDSYILDNNEGENTLHGGHNGLSTKKYSYKIKKNKSSIRVTFSYLDKQSCLGFPGDLLTKIVYTVNKNSLKISFKATSNKLTMCSLTNHTYYSLGANSLDELSLKIKASKYLHPNPLDLLPLEVRDVDRVMNFNKFKKITKYINDLYLINSKTQGYDHYFYFDDVNSFKSQIILKSSAYQLYIKTDFPGVQIYTDNYETKEVFNQSTMKIHRGIAIEPSASQAELHYLDKDEIYNHFITLKFKKVN